MLIEGRNKVRSHVRDCNSPTGGRYLGGPSPSPLPTSRGMFVNWSLQAAIQVFIGCGRPPDKRPFQLHVITSDTTQKSLFSGPTNCPRLRWIERIYETSGRFYALIENAYAV